MSETSRTTYIMAVPGSDETREIPRANLLEELARGTITSDNWVWSPEQEDWQQISEIPALKAAAHNGTTTSFAPTPIEPITLPANQVDGSKKKRKKSAAHSHRVDEKEEGLPYMKLLFALLYMVVAGIIAFNYLKIDKPFDGALAKTPFVLVSAHAHLGSFVQPNALVVHVLSSPELNETNFPDFLYTLARSTPNQPFQDKPFEMVALTSAWFSQYAMRGGDWQSLAGMTDATPEDRKNFVTDHLDNIAGQPLIRHIERLSPSDLKDARTHIWQDLTSSFLKKS